MNNNSVICSYIRDHHDTWRTDIEAKNITIRGNGSLAIFNYNMFADFADEVVQEARGIIINTGTLDVVCWPFRKFGNWNEPYADDIDWTTARVQDKIDGSIVKMWFDMEEAVWRWSTNGTVNASDAPIDASPYGAGRTFMDAIESAVNYPDVITAQDLCDKECTYIYELTGPENKVVIDYKEPRLWHIGTRNNITGRECNVDIGIDKPGEYALHSLSACIEKVHELNPEDSCIKEGFVVVDDNWKRVKIKSDEYLYLHRLNNNKVLTKDRILGFILSGDEDQLNDLLRYFPEYEVRIRYYQYMEADLRRNVSEIIRKARIAYAEYNGDRKCVAMAIKDSPYASFGFRAVGNTMSCREIYDKAQMRHKMNLIPDYAG